MTFDLKKLRMMIPGRDGKPLSQIEFAELVLKSIENNDDFTERGMQSKISKWEKNPDSITMADFQKICTALGLDYIQALSELEKVDPKPLNLKDPYISLKARLNLLNDYIGPVLRKSQDSKNEMKFYTELLNDFNWVIERLKFKPTLAFTGSFDAGKSALIKSLTGFESLITNWTPTTAISTFIVHVDDRPDFMNEDVWIFKHEPNSVEVWNFQKFREQEYCENWMLEKGHFDIFEKHGTHQGRKKYKITNAGAALIFLDAPILRACNIIDMPGFGSGTDSDLDEIQKQQVGMLAQAIVFLSTTNAFMGAQDIQYLKEVLRGLPVPSTNSEFEPYSNLLVVASQAHIQKSTSFALKKRYKEELSDILKRSENIYDFLAPRVKKRLESGIQSDNGKEYFIKRFIPFTLDDISIQRNFRTKLKEMLTKSVIPNYLLQMEEMILVFKNRAIDVTKSEFNKYDKILKHYDASKERFEEAKKNRPSTLIKIKKNLSNALDTIDQQREESVRDLDDWWDSNITNSEVQKRIEHNFDDKKIAAKFIGGIEVDRAKDKAEEIIENRMELCKPVITELFKDYESYANELSNLNLNESEIPFDFQGALAGAFAGAGVLGGLTLWASALSGNLGWYIVAAKGVSALSALGISVTGGTAGAMSFLAAIGGPVVAAAGLAILAALAVFSFFGASWQSRLAKNVVESLNKSSIQSDLKDQVSIFWKETSDGLEDVTELLKEKIDEYINDLEDLLESSEPKEIEQKIEATEEHRRYFENVPWKFL